MNMLCGMTICHPFFLFIMRASYFLHLIPHLIHLLDAVLEKVIMHYIGNQQNEEHNAQKDSRCGRGNHDHKDGHDLKYCEKDRYDQVDEPLMLEVGDLSLELGDLLIHPGKIILLHLMSHIKFYLSYIFRNILLHKITRTFCLCN